MFKKITLVVLGLMPVSVFAAVDVSTEVASLTADGTAAITAIGGALIGLAGIAVVYKWAKGMLFS
jgi:hypothetical protein